MKYLLIVLTQLLVYSGLAQSKMDTKSVDLFESEKPTMAKEENKASPDFFTIVEDMPVYPGGNTAFFEFIATNTKYPQEARRRGISGVVYVSYIVNTVGEVQNVRVVRGVDPLLDSEAVRVVKSLKGYSPGKQQGKAVNVQFTLPVRFNLGKPKRK